MNNTTTTTTTTAASQFMDKQIMDLSNSHSADFIDFMNRPPPKDDILPSYDFVPIRPAAGSSSSSPPQVGRSSDFDSGDDDAPPVKSSGSKFNASYPSLSGDEARRVLGMSKPADASSSLDAALVLEIDRTMKKYADNLMHAMDGVSARLSQLETRARNLENSVDDLKVSLGNNNGITDGRTRQLENILREVQTGVQDIRDKQEALEAQLHITKPVNLKEQEVESRSNTHINSTQPGAPANQMFSNMSLTHPPPILAPPNAPPSTPPQQMLEPQVQIPNQLLQNQVPSVPHQEPYFPPPGQTPENLNMQYQIPPPQQHQHQPQPPPQHNYQLPAQPQYSPPPPHSQPHPSFSGVNPSSPRPPYSHSHDEPLHAPSQNYRPMQSIPSGAPPAPSQQFYGGPTPNSHEPPSSRPNPGYSGSFGPASALGEPYPYSGSPRHYGGDAPMKPQQLPYQSGGSGYPQLPTARILPQALPTASGSSGGSGSGGSGNRVPIDDVVDKVTNMGFSREQVRATVRKLTENGQAVDLNVVLDKLMNDGDGQGHRGWFGQ